MRALSIIGRNGTFSIGLALLVLICGGAIAADVICSQGPWELSSHAFQHPFSSEAWLGTDMLGRDVLTDIIYGARISLIVGVVSTCAAMLIGICVGAVSGYFGGIVDEIVVRTTEFFQTIPSFLLAVVLVAIFQPALSSTIIAIAIVSWPPVARLVRGEFLTLSKREFVDAARVAGLPTWRIIIVEILPNAASPIITTGSLMVASAILLESSLGFLGLGDPNIMSWGYMIGNSRSVIRTGWWMTVFPGIAIMLTVLAINFIGDGLNHMLRPLGRADKVSQ
jgi:peptide/nickel transport system permease protein